MLALEPPDTFYLLAAVGWLELGNPVEAKAELGHLRPVAQNHPDVLEVRWMLCVKEEDWGEGLVVARALLQQAPRRASGWLYQAYALRRIPGGGLPQAWEALLPAAEKFPKEDVIPFNLACYACQMNRLDTARHWLQQAMQIGGKKSIIERALSDSDLEPLWEELKRGRKDPGTQEGIAGDE